MNKSILMNQHIPWVEKYRPTNLSDVVLDEINKQILVNIIDKNYFPNLLLYGPPGTGKTTTIINLIDKSPPDVIYSAACKSNLIISNDTGPGHIAALSGVNTLWLALDNPITKANLSFRQNSHLVLKNSMEDLTVDEVTDYISNNKLLDKVD